MAIGNGKLVHECFPKHSRMGTARMKYIKERREYGKSKAGMKKKPDDLSYLIKIK